ncbi:MAG TPA: methyltransferase domain-containing protein [Anaerolineales bacterium]|nr:methyltransferase domain-containing protein [Anaerolineales bacterium]
MTQTDLFPPSDFDPWAKTYDDDVRQQSVFPFDGYARVLETVVNLAEPRGGMSVLDLGTGTGNLAVMFAERGCDLWCTDFSEAMLAKAREKVPQAHFVLADLRADWSPELDRRFDRIVSAYVFHHLELDEKVRVCRELVTQRLDPNGALIIGDLSFPNKAEMDRFAKSVGDLWDEEFYWLADESIPALEAAGLTVSYQQISACAGVYRLR